MSCSISKDNVIDITIKLDHVNELYKNLYDTKENGGELLIDHINNTSSKVVVTHAGQSDSTDSPDSIFNWHSHPIGCYKKEKTLWGWFSGEDIRESIIYGLRGSACHFIPSVEGLYTVQPNPCIITSLLSIEKLININNYQDVAKFIEKKRWNLGNFLRGFLILSIEIYFRSTHTFRTTDFLKKNKHITPEDFVKFSNSFKLSNLFEKRDVEGCSKIKCNQVHTFEGNKIKNVSFKNYVNDYESGDDTNLFLVDTDGKYTMTDVKYSNIIKLGSLELLRDLKLGDPCNISIPTFHKSNMIQMKFYPNFVKFNEKLVKYVDMSYEEKYKFINEQNHSNGDVQICKKSDIKVKLFKISGNCNYKHLKNHMTSFGQIGNVEKITSDKRTSKKRTSKKRTSKKRKLFGNKRKSKKRKSKKRKSKKRKSKINKLIIIGSDNCGYCRIAHDKAIEMKKTKKFDLKYLKYDDIKQAINTAREKTGENIMTIPVYILNGKVEKDPYARF
jgi:hypothetical protein